MTSRRSAHLRRGERRVHYAHPNTNTPTARSGFRSCSSTNGLVEQQVKNDIQPDRHAEVAHYLYADGHVDVIAAAQIDEWIAAEYDFAKPE